MMHSVAEYRTLTQCRTDSSMFDWESDHPKTFPTLSHFCLKDSGCSAISFCSIQYRDVLKSSGPFERMFAWEAHRIVVRRFK